MTKKYDLLVFIGRFQPFHLGHKQVVKDALQITNHLLILVGSSYQPRTIKNPFTAQERTEMILGSLDPQDIARITIRPLRDYPYNDQKWAAEVQQNVYLLKEMNDDIGIIGYDKDESSYYLQMFPQWEFVQVDYNDNIDATTIRNIWLDPAMSNRLGSGALTAQTFSWMFNHFPQSKKKEYERLQREWEQITDYKKQWAGTKHPVIFNTTDAVIIQSGHILLVQRKSSPGEGLWALPGGFLKPEETIETGMIRELREETKLKVPDPVLRGSTKARKVFDYPSRSLRGRTITHAFLIELAPGKLPAVKGSDDAKKAMWVPLADFEKMEEVMFEDHFYIINYFLGRV